jgi:hypothetical protein
VPTHGEPMMKLAALEGHFRGPALSWSELVAAANQDDGQLSPAARLLLLLPAAGDIDTPGDARDLVAAAVTSVSASRQQVSVASELLNSHGYWTPCPWTIRDEVPVCAGPHSYRSAGGGLTQQQLRMIAHAFAGCESTREA